MAEAEAGVGYEFTSWPIRPFVRASIITQYYGGGGADLNPNANIFLYGVNVTVGLRF